MVSQVKSIKVKDLAVGRSFRGANGEVRKITRIRGHFDDSIFIDWERTGERAKGTREGTTTAQLFARWAAEKLPNLEELEALAAGQQPLFVNNERTAQ
jgi:hypothetical protein